jgi:hypothetical protein
LKLLYLFRNVSINLPTINQRRTPGISFSRVRVSSDGCGQIFATAIVVVLQACLDPGLRRDDDFAVASTFGTSEGLRLVFPIFRHAGEGRHPRQGAASAMSKLVVDPGLRRDDVLEEHGRNALEGRMHPNFRHARAGGIRSSVEFITVFWPG